MFYKLNDDELKKINEASEKTYSDYELVGDFIPVENLMAAIEDLLVEVGRLEEKYKDLEQNLEDNYKPISYSEQVGYREEDYYE